MSWRSGLIRERRRAKSGGVAKRIIRFLSSLKLAVVIILALAIIAAIGTIYESKYDAEYAQKVIYQSTAMYLALGALCVSLIAVMVSRWPWQRHHAGFVCAHIGILALLLGAYITSEFGVDGSMSFGMSESRRGVMVSRQEMSIYASFDGSTYQRLAYTPVDFLKRPVSVRHPFVIDIGSNPLEVFNYVHFALRNSEVVASERQGDGPALRISLQNAFVSQTEWIRRDLRKPVEIKNLGPAQIIMSDGHYKPQGQTAVVFSPGANESEMRYELYNRDKGRVGRGILREGTNIQTEWAGMVLRVLRYFPHSREKVEYTDVGYPNSQTSPAIQVRWRGDEFWLGLNSQLRVYTEDTAYQINFNNTQLELPFQLTLKAFRVGRYPGTARAASYESDVTVDQGTETTTISMNEPLKHGGYTFYQSSFEEDPSGKPVLSILSVNHDPGRFLKYLGSFLIVLGAILLFYFKRQGRRSECAS